MLPLGASSDEQVGDLINAYTSKKHGLLKRPAFSDVSQISATVAGYAGAFYHFFKTADGTKYLLVITEAGTLQIFNVTTGTAQTLYSPSGVGILGATASNTFRALTVGDYTFLLNKNKTVAASSAKYTPAVTKPIAYVEVRQADYSTPFQIILNNGQTTATVTTAPNTSSASRAAIETTKVAADLVTTLQADTYFAREFTVTRDGSILTIYRQDSLDFGIDVRDGLGEAGLRLTKERVQTLDDLPARADTGVVVKIEGNPGSSKDNTWVVFENEKTKNLGSVTERRGFWRETLAPGTPLRLDPTTMPWALVKNGVIEPQQKQAAKAPRAYVIETAANYVRWQFDATAKYPPGFVATYTPRVDSSTTYTVPGTTFVTGAQLATALQAAFVQRATDTAASHTYTVTNPNPGELKIVDSFAATPSATAMVETYPVNTFWSWDLSMVAAEHVGRILKNRTDACYGTVTANGVYHITCGAGLTSGATNTFTEGDYGAVYGSQATYFVWDQVYWTDRLCGDLDSAPWPSFVGRKISDIFFHENRMGFVADDAVVMSAANDLFRVFRRTTTSLLADDPVDVKNATKFAASFLSALPWDTGVLLTGTTGHQFLLTGLPAITPTTVRLDYLCSIPTSSTPFRPTLMGARVRFVRIRDNGRADCLEMYRDGYGIVKTEELTAHVPSYIIGTPNGAVADNNIGVMILSTGYPTTTLYVNAVAYSGDDRIQNAWSTWTIQGNGVFAMDFTDGSLSIVNMYDAPTNAVYIQSMDLSTPPVGPMLPRRDPVHAPSTGYYTVSMGLLPFFRRNKNGHTVQDGRLQIRRMKLRHAGAYSIVVTVNLLDRPPITYTFSPADPNIPGEVSVPILCDSRRIDYITISEVGSNIQAFQIVNLQWEGYLTLRSQPT